VYLGHGFQTQGTVATVVDLKMRRELTCVPGPWISDPRYGCRRSELEGATEVDLCTWAMDFRPKVGCRRSELEGVTGVDLCTWAMDFRPKVRSAST
jgi:hypothetical protein